jgi:hypothetical protein
MGQNQVFAGRRQGMRCGYALHRLNCMYETWRRFLLSPRLFSAFSKKSFGFKRFKLIRVMSTSQISAEARCDPALHSTGPELPSPKG